ncbi:MAG: transporter substrate-binding domain-containing protein [Burkholderiaceae bacterium]
MAPEGRFLHAGRLWIRSGTGPWPAWLLVVCVWLLANQAIAQPTARSGAPDIAASRVPPDFLTIPERDFIGSHRLIRVAIARENYAPLQYIDEQGQPAGVAVGVLNAIGESLDVRLEPVYFDRWQEALDAVRKREADVLPYAAYTPARDEFLDFTVGIVRNPLALMGFRGVDLHRTNPNLAGVRIAVPTGYASEKYLPTLFPNAITVPINGDIGQMLAALRDHRADYYVGPIVETMTEARRTGLTDFEFKRQLYFGSGWAHIAIRDDWAAYVPIFNRVISDGLAERASPLGSAPGIPDPGGPTISLTDREARIIGDLGTLRVGAVRGLHALNDMDSTGTHLGIAAEYTSLIAHRLGVPIRVLPFDSVADMIDAALDARIDVIPFFTRTPARDADFAFSKPYVAMPYVLLSRADAALYWDLGSLRGHRVALAARHPLIPIIEQRYPEITIVTAANGEQAMAAVVDGRADAAVEVKLYANQFVNTRFAGELRAVAQIEELPAEFRMAVPHRLQALVPALDRVIESMSAIEHDRAMRRWVAIDLEPQRRLRRYLSLLIPSIVALTGLVLVTLFWNRRLAQEGRRRLRAEQHLTDMTDHLPAGVYQYRQHGGKRLEPEFANRAAREMARVAGDSHDILTGVLAHVGTDDRNRVKDAVRRSIRSGEPFSETFSFEFPDGTQGWMLAEARARPEADGTRSWTGYLFDLTQERGLLAELNASIASRERFFATAGHELRSPVQNMWLAIEAIRADALPARDREVLEVARSSARELEELIADLLDLSRVQARGITVRPQFIDVAAVVHSVLRSFELPAEAKGDTLDASIDPTVPRRVWVDPMRIRQILHNLVNNAVKYSTNSRVHVSLAFESSGRAPDAGETSGRGPEGRLVVKVADTGPGIPADKIDHIFEPFAVIDETKRGSTGLGLSIVKELVERMNGRIAIESAPGKGSTFTVHLPASISRGELREQSRTAEQMTSLPSDGILAATTADHRLLLVDDNRLSRVLFAAGLRGVGLIVDEADDLEMARALLDRHQYAVACIDLNLPDGNGGELAREIRNRVAEPSATKPFLIAVTGEAAGIDVLAIREPFDEFLVKPVSQERLNRLVLAAIGLRPQNVSRPGVAPAFAPPARTGPG